MQLPLFPRRPDVADVGCRTVWASAQMPNLGIERIDFPYRVYVLRCKPKCPRTAGPFHYAGFEHRDKIKKRLVDQFAQGENAAFYCQENKPIEIEMIWPAPSRATEAFVFHSLLAELHAGWQRKGEQGLCPLGGWTQNDTVLSPLSSLVYEQSRRGMRNPCCFNCGGPHYKKDCTKAIRGMTLTCPHPQCKQEIVLSSRGQTVPSVVVPQRAVGSTTEVQKKSNAQAAPSGGGTDRKRLAPSGNAGRPPAKMQKTGKEVSICGKRYTSLSWFLNTPNPPPKKCEMVRNVCVQNAVLMRGGHVRALDAAKFSVSPSAFVGPPPLLGERRNLPNSWVDTEVTDIQVRRAPQPLKARLSQVLWLVSDLERTL